MYALESQNGPFRYLHMVGDPTLGALQIGDLDRLRSTNPYNVYREDFNVIYAPMWLIRLFRAHHEMYCWYRFCRDKTELEAIRGVRAWFCNMAGCWGYDLTDGSSLYYRSSRV